MAPYLVMARGDDKLKLLRAATKSTSSRSGGSTSSRSGGSSRRSTGGSSGVSLASKVLTAKRKRDQERSQETFRAGVGELERLAADGAYGAEQALAVYDKLMASDLSADQKAKIQSVAEGHGIGKAESKDRPLWQKALAPLGNAIKTTGMVLDKPLRAAVATLDEGQEALWSQVYGKDVGDDKSWWDKVARDGSYGFGHAWENAKNIEEQGTGRKADLFGVDTEKRLEVNVPLVNKKVGVSGDQLIGFAGDVALDPLTYLTGGAAVAAKGGSNAAEIARAERLLGVAKNADEAADATRALERATQASQAARRVSRTKLNRTQLADRLAEAGLDDAAARVARRGASGATGAELAEVGVEGGLRWAGRQIVDHDNLGKVTGKLGGVSEAWRKSNTYGKAASKLGREELAPLRALVRDPESTTDQIAGALKQISAKNVKHRAQSRFAATVGEDVRKTLVQAEKAGVDDNELYHAVTGHVPSRAAVDAIDPEIVPRVQEAVAKVRAAVNERAGYDVVEDVGQDYLHRVVSDEYRDFARELGWWDDAMDGASSAVPSFERRAFRAGDEFAGETLGSPQLHERFSPDHVPASRGAIEAQMQGIGRELGVPDEIAMFTDDGYESMARSVRAASDRVGQLAEARELIARGAGVRNPNHSTITEGLSEAKARLVERQQSLASRLGLTVDEVMDPNRADAIRYMFSDRPKKLAQVERQLGELQRYSAHYDSMAEAALLVHGDAQVVGRALDAATENARLAAEAGNDAAAQSFAAQARRLGELRDMPQDAPMRPFAALSAQADSLQGALAMGDQRWMGALASPADGDRVVAQLRAHKDVISQVLDDGFKSMADVGFPMHQLPEWQYDAIRIANEFREAPSNLVKLYDGVNQHFKKYALFSPGFHVRNFVGGVFNNAVAGVTNPKRYAESISGLRQFRKGGVDAVQDPKFREFLRVLERDGGVLYENARVAAEFSHWGGRNAVDAIEAMPLPSTQRATRLGEKAGNSLQERLGGVLGPQGAEAVGKTVRGSTAALTVAPRWATERSHAMGDGIEELLRTTLAWHSWNEGLGMGEIMSKVHQFHFDYSDLSKLETEWIRRVVPFWTWTSRNMPLQLQATWTDPSAYAKFRSLKRNLEGDNETDPLFHPSYLRDTLSNIRIGENDYLGIDLPFAEVDENLVNVQNNGPIGLLGSTSPLVKLPIERMFGVQSFTGAPLTGDLKPVPSAWRGWLVPLLTPLGAIERGPNGEPLMRQRDIYTAEQLLPQLGRARRLMPGDEKAMADRRTASLLSFFGIFNRKVTDDLKGNEAWRTKDYLEAQLKDARATGKAETSAQKAERQEAEKAERERKREAQRRLKELLGK